MRFFRVVLPGCSCQDVCCQDSVARAVLSMMLLPWVLFPGAAHARGPRAGCCPGAVAEVLRGAVDRMLLPRCCEGSCQLFARCYAGSLRHVGLPGAVAS